MKRFYVSTAKGIILFQVISEMEINFIQDVFCNLKAQRIAPITSTHLLLHYMLFGHTAQPCKILKVLQLPHNYHFHHLNSYFFH